MADHTEIESALDAYEAVRDVGVTHLRVRAARVIEANAPTWLRQLLDENAELSARLAEEIYVAENVPRLAAAELVPICEALGVASTFDGPGALGGRCVEAIERLLLDVAELRRDVERLRREVEARPEISVEDAALHDEGLTIPIDLMRDEQVRAAWDRIDEALRAHGQKAGE